MGANQNSSMESDLCPKINSKNSLSHLRHFTEHLVDVFRKLPWENDLDHKSSSLLIRRLKNHTGDHLQQFTHSKNFAWR